MPNAKTTLPQFPSFNSEEDIQRLQSISGAIALLLDNVSMVPKEIISGIHQALQRLSSEARWTKDADSVRDVLPTVMAAHREHMLQSYEAWRLSQEDQKN